MLLILLLVYYMTSSGVIIAFFITAIQHTIPYILRISNEANIVEIHNIDNILE